MKRAEKDVRARAGPGHEASKRTYRRRYGTVEVAGGLYEHLREQIRHAGGAHYLGKRKHRANRRYRKGVAAQGREKKRGEAGGSKLLAKPSSECRKQNHDAGGWLMADGRDCVQGEKRHDKREGQPRPELAMEVEPFFVPGKAEGDHCANPPYYVGKFAR